MPGAQKAFADERGREGGWHKLCLHLASIDAGTVTELRGSDRAEMAPGDVFVIETPGGGGFGPPSCDLPYDGVENNS